MDKRISLLAATGLAALSLGAAAPALAAEPVFPLGGPSALVLQPAPDTGASKERSLRYELAYVGPGNSFPGEFTVTVDLTKAAAVASVRLDPAKPRPNCTTSATAIVCKQQGLSVGTGGNGNSFDLLVSAAEDAKNGASGEIAVTGRVAGAGVTPVTTKLTVGGPDLYLGELKPKAEVTAGEQQDLPLAFANRGTLPARSVALELDTSAGLEPAETYDNCRRQDHGGMGATTVCLVEGEFLPGESYQLAPDSPLHLKTTERAYQDRLRYGVVPDPAPVKDASEGKPATGKKLKLVKASAAVPVTDSNLDARDARHAEDTDLNPRDNERTFEFTAKGARADFEAVTASPSGKVGDTVVAELGFRNKGPAVISHLRSGESVARTDIVMPAGVQVTDVPRNCRAVSADGSDRAEQLGAPRYFCDGGMFADVSGAYTGRFSMKIEKAVADAKGSVTVGEPVAGGTKPLAFDPVGGNSKAVFVVEVKGGTSPSPSGSASASPSASASASPSASVSPSASAFASAAGGTGGNLASTGSSVGPIALGALGAVAVGGALYVGVRRRSGGHA
ncbi:peptidase [Streptomyces sp. NPDC127051]|uniref:peptidase n=1 Tax=Streptomyces sp. NPDC127051 TaxID=3347119 RepID=UPI00364B0892